MNQNTTIETIRMIANRLLNPDSNRIDVRSDLCALANRLEAAPQPQPPVEQSEPAAEHPLHAGYVILDGEKRELRRSMRVNICPFCDTNFFNGEHNPDKCKARYVPAPIYQFLAPPAVIEPEPELDEFEAHLEYLANMSCNNDREQSILDNLLDKYREIVTRKGDK